MKLRFHCVIFVEFLISFIRISSLLISIKCVIILVLSYRYLATGGGVQVGNSCFFYYCCHGWCGWSLHQQTAKQQRFRGQQITYRVLCQYKRKKESPDCAATRFGDFILCPHGLAISFLPMAILAFKYKAHCPFFPNKLV